MKKVLGIVVMVLSLGCGESTPSTFRGISDASPEDATGSSDDTVSVDTASADTGPENTGSADTGSADTGPENTGFDTGPADTGSADTGPENTGFDTGPADTGPANTGFDTGDVDTGPANTGFDTGDVDTGPANTGSVDTGSLDTGPANTGFDTVELTDPTDTCLYIDTQTNTYMNQCLDPPTDFDTGVADTGDTGSATGSADTGSADTGTADTGSVIDTGPWDTGFDTGIVDTGPLDTGSEDTEITDTVFEDTAPDSTDLGPYCHYRPTGYTDNSWINCGENPFENGDAVCCAEEVKALWANSGIDNIRCSPTPEMTAILWFQTPPETILDHAKTYCSEHGGHLASLPELDVIIPCAQRTTVEFCLSDYASPKVFAQLVGNAIHYAHCSSNSGRMYWAATNELSFSSRTGFCILP